MSRCSAATFCHFKLWVARRAYWDCPRCNFELHWFTDEPTGNSAPIWDYQGVLGVIAIRSVVERQQQIVM
jgi:hypothetical protein